MACHISQLGENFCLCFCFFRVLGICNFNLKQEKGEEDTEYLKWAKRNANEQLGFFFKSLFVLERSGTWRLKDRLRFVVCSISIPFHFPALCAYQVASPYVTLSPLFFCGGNHEISPCYRAAGRTGGSHEDVPSVRDTQSLLRKWHLDWGILAIWELLDPESCLGPGSFRTLLSGVP